MSIMFNEICINEEMLPKYIYIINFYNYSGGAHGVIVIVVGNGHSDTSSNPGPG